MSSRFPRGFSKRVDNEDDALAGRLAQVNVRPIFIVGLHRSGTTFLYQSLVRLLPLAYLSPYEILFYPRLLSRYFSGAVDEDRSALDDLFARWGQRDRGIDTIPLSSRTPEEYGWLLKRYAGSMRFGRRTAALMDEMCRKLLLVQGRSSVLLKNPWDVSRCIEIYRHFPQAKFIYISRDPVAILQSQLQNVLLFSTSPSPYLDLLLDGFRLGKIWFAFQRMLYRLGGESLLVRFMLPILMRDISGELKSYSETLAALPKECRIELSYNQLTTDPQSALRRVCEFLQMNPQVGFDVIEARPRHTPLHPEVSRAKDRFLSRLGPIG